MTTTRVRFALAGLLAGGLAAASMALAAVPAGAAGGGGEDGDGGTDAPSAEREILVVEVDGLLDPVLEDLVLATLDEAERAEAALFVLAIDAPGSVDVDMSRLVAAVAEAEVPVAAWVKGNGVAERSAAVLALAADVAAMATDGRIGQAAGSLDGREAFPEPLPESVREVFDGAAFDAVAEATLGPEEAEAAEVVDLVAPTLRDLVALLDGVELTVGGESVTLGLGEVVEEDDGEARKRVAPIRFREMGLVDQLQHALTGPFVALLLLLTGLSLMVFEFFAIGVGVAAACGALLVMAAFVGFGHLPVDQVSFVLVVAAFVALSIDVQAGAPRFWAAVGSVMLTVGAVRFYGGASALDPPVWQVLLLVAGVLLFVLPGLAAVIRSRFSTPTIGRESMVGERGVAQVEFDPDGVVVVRGAPWRAHATRAAQLGPGDPVEVTAVRGLVLEVQPVETGDPGGPESRA